MTTVRIADPSRLTQEQADQILRSIFDARLGILRAEAAAEKKIAAIRADLDAATSADRASLTEHEGKLASYVLAHQEQFQKPRMRKTSFGRYGLRSSTRTMIDDETALIAWADANGLADLVATVRRPVLPAVAKRLSDGVAIPGAHTETADAAEYKLDPAALAEAL